MLSIVLMNELKSFKTRVQNLANERFEQLALEIFRFQAVHCGVYREYLESLNIKAESITSLNDIPFLPIEFFKNHRVSTLEWSENAVFRSSGTTSTVRSQHLVEDLNYYLQLSLRNFQNFFGSIKECEIYALLPSYREQGNSSLIAMVDHLISHSSRGGYFLDNFEHLESELRNRLNRNSKVILFGVGYALLDFVDYVKNPLDGLVIVETGGMKGRRQELTKEDYYAILKKNLGEVGICSEYGMTELLSQAYSMDEIYYEPVPQLKVLVRDLNDPFLTLPHNKTGQINVIDLANVHSCCFVETQDIGRMAANGTFEVLGRKDNSDIRGCNLLIG